MSIIDLYQNKKNKIFPFTGYFVVEDKELAFSYRKVPRRNISSNKTLHGVVIPETDITISTFSVQDFNINDKVILDKKQYAITAMYKEPEEDVLNGAYRKTISELKYLILRG